MYSRKDWIIDPKDVQGSLAELVYETPELAGILSSDDVLAVDPDQDDDDEANPDVAGWTEVDLLAR